MGLWFEWDSRKAQGNKKKHGISFEEASTVFGDPLSITIPDPGHSTGQDRYITMGTSRRGNLIVVMHTDSKDNIRIITARKATRNERKQYEQG